MFVQRKLMTDGKTKVAFYFEIKGTKNPVIIWHFNEAGGELSTEGNRRKYFLNLRLSKHFEESRLCA